MVAVVGAAALVVAPVVWLDPAALFDPRAWLLLTVIVGFATGEILAHRGIDAGPVTQQPLELITGIGVLAAFIAAGAQRGELWMLAPVGGCIALVGIWLRVTALRQLGSLFVSGARAAPASTLVTIGIYARVRHPSELGLIAIAVGAAAVTASAVSTAIALGLIALIAVRIRREDRQLVHTFGAPYVAYARRVRALIPGSASAARRADPGSRHGTSRSAVFPS
jgi:protein-S-isoprenylcysteine O-methyltransferase Ste14